MQRVARPGLSILVRVLSGSLGKPPVIMQDAGVLLSSP